MFFVSGHLTVVGLVRASVTKDRRVPTLLYYLVLWPVLILPRNLPFFSGSYIIFINLKFFQMNEPLTNSRPGISFCGKAHNNHPQWYNQPIRLTKEQKRDPLPVLDDFFECYHLNEVRYILWEWLTEALSSQRSVAIEPLERNNHIYFYEKIEGIIEAAYVIKKKIHKHRHKREKRKLKQGTQTARHEAKDINYGAGSKKLILATETDTEQLYKPKMLIEYVDITPMYVINEVFKNDSLSFLRDQIRDWLLIALSADTAIYEPGEQRKQLLLFQEQLQVLVEALFIIYTQNREKANVKVDLTESDKPRLLSQDQISNPTQVITGFFEQFPMIYIARELNDWLEASLCFAGTYPENMSKWQAFYTHRSVECLIKAANRL
ncbi:hypothetical protein A4D02_34665 [Niastella koreensis]|nr:hypothetical protein A4D02_34665 [Niastella koreensis]